MDTEQIVALAGVVGLIVSSYVSVYVARTRAKRSETLSLYKLVDKLQKDSETIREELDKMRAEYRAVVKELEEVQLELVQSRAENAALRAQNEGLQRRVAELETAQPKRKNTGALG